MIITIKGADFSAKNIGTLSTWTIFTTLGSGATYSGSRAVDKDGSLSATITIADGYNLGSAGVSVMMGTTDVTSSAADINGNTITINIAKVTSNVTIKVTTLNTSTGEESGGESGGGNVVEPETPINGQWLSVLLTGDENAHENFMNGNLTGAGSLASGRDVIYAETNMQALFEGKKIYKIASNGLNANTITLYSNPWKGANASNTTDGRTPVGTVTGTLEQAQGTIFEYSVSNPTAIKDNETLSVQWSAQASGIKTVENYITKVYYLNPQASTTFASPLGTFCSFDFFIGD